MEKLIITVYFANKGNKSITNFKRTFQTNSTILKENSAITEI